MNLYYFDNTDNIKPNKPYLLDEKSVCKQPSKDLSVLMICYSGFLCTFVFNIRFLWRNGCFCLTLSSL